jgi:hypothetical protein
MILRKVKKVSVAVIAGVKMAERCFNFDEVYVAQVFPMCWVFDDWQQQPWQEGLVAHVVCIFGGAPQVPSHDF